MKTFIRVFYYANNNHDYHLIWNHRKQKWQYIIINEIESLLREADAGFFSIESVYDNVFYLQTKRMIRPTLTHTTYIDRRNTLIERSKERESLMKAYSSLQYE